ncbi:hypothetical protein GCM10010170_075230 [Dactylosporangium salmoneum]|uniref:Uncharacterized protein n=1 Tax=Dactylosporangium salmoneum TaxID=53361 RepID=A0ABN3H919_9ACTN
MPEAPFHVTAKLLFENEIDHGQCGRCTASASWSVGALRVGVLFGLSAQVTVDAWKQPAQFLVEGGLVGCADMER